MGASKKEITYVGPKDVNDVGTVYRLPGRPGAEDLVLTKGVPTKVTDAQAKALKADKAHVFKAGAPSEPDEDAPWPDYADLDAEVVVERIADPSQVPNADVARAVLEHEKSTQKRKSVVEAAEAQLAAYEAGEGAEGVEKENE